MSLKELHFTFVPEKPRPFPLAWHHCGVVGSGDMEVMFERKKLGGSVEFKVVTPLRGFDEVWEKVLGRFVDESGVSDVSIEINDNSATPVVVALRMRQALEEAKREASA